MDNSVRRVIFLQGGITLLLGALALIFANAAFAYAVFIGGAIGLLSSWVYAKRAFATKHVAPAVLLRAHFIAELLKVGLTIALFALVLSFLKELSGLALLLGYIGSLAGYWLALLNSNSFFDGF